MIEALAGALRKVEGETLAARLETVQTLGGQRLEGVAGTGTLDELIGIAKGVPAGSLEEELASAFLQIDELPALRQKVEAAVPYLGLAVSFLGLAGRPAPPSSE